MRHLAGKIEFKDGKKRTNKHKRVISNRPLQEHDSLILRHGKTRDVGFLHFHDLMQVVSDPLLQKSIFAFPNISMIIYSTDIANKVT